MTGERPKLPAPGWQPTAFVLDVDGVMTDGRFIYARDGKMLKSFGPDDHDALLLLKPHLEIRFISGDRKGFEITQKRIERDMGFPLDLVSTIQRAEWFRRNTVSEQTVYMADGIFDPWVFPHVGYTIAPANAFVGTRERAHYVTTCDGGDRAVAEACLHLLERFFEPFDPDRVPEKFSSSGEWVMQ